jgi:DNA-binding LacI/PurR family transcriptional regulator
MSKEGETIRSIAARGLPMVIVDQPLIPKVPFVGIDNRLAARSCGQHLKDLGHQDFAIGTFPLGSDGHCGLVDRKVFHRVEAGAFPEGDTESQNP